jgi:hypothetical protein
MYKERKTPWPHAEETQTPKGRDEKNDKRMSELKAKS